jgi:hypothetical protein
MHDLDVTRRAYKPGERAAIARAAAFAGLAARQAARSPAAVFVVAGRYDRRAIMAAAIKAAQSRRAATGEAWNVCLSAALKGAWQTAKAQRAAKAH